MSGKKLHHRKQHGAEFLDPENVGSSIRWKVESTVKQHKGTDKTPPHTTGCIDTEIHLTDCSEAISWSDYGATAEDMNRKIDRTINQLREYQRALAAAEKSVKKYHTDPVGEDE